LVSDSDTLTRRMDGLLARLRTSYDGIGHSSGRPYIYFIYPPEQDRAVRLLATDTLRDDAGLRFHHIDLLPLTITAIKNQEDQRRALLLDPRAPSAAGDILRLWTRALLRDVATALGSPATSGRPVVVLRGLAALHPLGNPTAVMEGIAEQEPRDPATNRIVPIVLLIPATWPARTSRAYRFLGLESSTLDFYCGEEI